VAYVGGRTNGRARQAPAGQAASEDRLRAGIEGSGGGRQAEIAMSHQGRDLRRRTDGHAGTGNSAAKRRDGLYF